MHAELFEVDVVTGRRTGRVATARRALRAIRDADVPYAVIGATALGVRGLPRMTQDLDLVVVSDDAFNAIEALQAAGFKAIPPVRRHTDPEAMYVLTPDGGQGDVDVLVAHGEPESTIVAEAPRTKVFGVEAPVATLEHLLLMYLYSNQPKHLGDFARIVTEGAPDIGACERYLADVHPEMLAAFGSRVYAARNPAPAPPRPPRRRR